MTRPYSLSANLTTNYAVDEGYTDVVYGQLTIGLGNYLTIGLNGFLLIL